LFKVCFIISPLPEGDYKVTFRRAVEVLGIEMRELGAGFVDFKRDVIQQVNEYNPREVPEPLPEHPGRIERAGNALIELAQKI
jgi:hypothetical protein